MFQIGSEARGGLKRTSGFYETAHPQC
jgi:hypothetical protein